MRTAVDPQDRQFLERLHRLESATVQEICADLGVTATAVRQRLGRLLSAGLIHRVTVRAGRGRPHHTYEVTEAGLRELGDNYSDLAMILWRELQRIEDPQVRGQVLNRVEDAMVAQYGRMPETLPLPERMDHLRAALEERGFDVETDLKGTLPILRENNCPYHELAAADPGICELEQSVFRRVLGADVTLTQRCLDGHSCCEFQAVSKD